MGFGMISLIFMRKKVLLIVSILLFSLEGIAQNDFSCAGKRFSSSAPIREDQLYFIDDSLCVIYQSINYEGVSEKYKDIALLCKYVFNSSDSTIKIAHVYSPLPKYLKKRSRYIHIISSEDWEKLDFYYRRAGDEWAFNPDGSYKGHQIDKPWFYKMNKRVGYIYNPKGIIYKVQIDQSILIWLMLPGSDIRRANAFSRNKTIGSIVIFFPEEKFKKFPERQSFVDSVIQSYKCKIP